MIRARIEERISMPTIDEQIAQSLRESLRNGELQSAASGGKPLDLDDGYAQTPDELRMAFKALKDAGFVPPEVETMRQIAALRQMLDAGPAAPTADAMRTRLSELQQHLALRLEKLRTSGSL
ncbi:MAG: DUF1992 domain-containing protein [Burkholderiales bacterium]|nr:DUF1992 domain-containing protein [Burkholderiales bacterium]